MALANKLGSLLKKATGSNPSLYQAIRCMSSSKLFIGGLSYSTDESTLKDAFSHYGEIIDAKIIIDRDTGRSRGFGFITYTADEHASSAIMAMDGKDLHGRNIRVSPATERTSGFRDGGGYGGGGYGGGGSYGGNRGGDNFAPAGGDNFAASNFGADGGSAGGDEFTSGSPGSNFENAKNDDTMNNLFKDTEPDTYASKGV